MRRFATLLGALMLVTVPAASAGPFATLWTISPGVDAPRVNDQTCKPDAGHPAPVVLVHGTWGDRTVSWNLIGEKLINDGYCVFALDYGNRATGPVAQSAQQLKTFVDQVLATTGAARVSIVGHSQGGMMPRYFVKSLAGDTKVDDLIGLSPSNHGTTNQFASYPAQYGDSPSAADQAAGSPFITALNAGDETPQPDQELHPGLRISYTNLATRYDEVVMPAPTSQFLAGSAAEVTNVLVQDKCPEDFTDHVGMVYDPVSVQWVENALSRPGPADPTFDPTC